MLALTTQAQKYVGGDISLLTKYEEANVVYRDKKGTAVQPLEFFKAEGLNAMRVRLFVDPSQATTSEKKNGVCQDLEYVKALGKRIKDAGFKFMLDFHYSDTWADPSKQWTPSAWLSLTDEQLFQKIYDYTKESLQALVAAGAEPDFIQTGNEISYGMLYGKGIITKNTDTETEYQGSSSSYKKCYTSSNANWNRFISLLKKASQACREVCPNAQIILHTERVPNTSTLTYFYDKMKTDGVGYDIIGLSYYPAYHGNINQLRTALNTLESKNYGKNIMIVEMGYPYKWAMDGTIYNLTSTYPYTEEGQRQMTADIITELNQHSSVTGLFWWWLEDNGNANVTGGWWNAGIYNHDTGMPYAAFYELKKFVGGDDSQEQDVTSKYITNPSFDSDISGWANTGGTAEWKQNTWAPMSNYCQFAWTGNAIADQEVVQTVTLPAGTYTLTFNCASDNGSKGVFIIAGDQSTEMGGTGNVETGSITFTLSASAAIKIGLKLQSTTATWVNFDNFVLTQTTGVQSAIVDKQKVDNAWYTLDGRRLAEKPTAKGIYINGGKKIVVK